jgi:hypothetical protein
LKKKFLDVVNTDTHKGALQKNAPRVYCEHSIGSLLHKSIGWYPLVSCDHGKPLKWSRVSCEAGSLLHKSIGWYPLVSCDHGKPLKWSRVSCEAGHHESDRSDTQVTLGLVNRKKKSTQ